MNFVDVQPKSFLDYAWTTPSSSVMTGTKSSKTSRKQNRCCDQCRKGKRACDAAILEDALLDENNKPGGNPTSFHYSDVFGPLAPCGNCEKTKKGCTFEWLRSQRVLQSTQPQATVTPPTKRRRTSSSKSTSQEGSSRQSHSVGPTNQFVATNGGGIPQRAAPLDLGVTFADFPGGPPGVFDIDPSPNYFDTISPISLETVSRDCGRDLTGMFDGNDVVLDCDSGKGTSLATLSETFDERTENDSSYASSSKTTSEASTEPERSIMRVGRKKRRRSSSISTAISSLPYSSISFASDLVLSTNNAFLTENLLKIYHNSFENALSCWVTERTCPYSTEADVALINDARPDWNRIYHRVFRLDRLSANLRGRQLTYTEDTAASKALNMAIYAFATQWAQSSQKSNAKYPFDGALSTAAMDVESDSTTRTEDFDRMLQINAWHEAHSALQAAGEIESFRVVLAQIVFALTQKPMEEPEPMQDVHLDHVKSENGLDDGAVETDHGVSECQDLLAKLDLAIDADGPPTHLEQGLRLIHSLRSRMSICNDRPRVKSGTRQYRPSTGRLSNSDRAAVDLLFWLGVMFDTLSAAMNKRPLVVSDEDSDIYPERPKPTAASTTNGDTTMAIDRADGLWDGYLFARQDSRLQESPIRWPCSFDQAAALLCDAAPVKVVLFRKITRIQTLLTRNARGAKVEESLSAALAVYAHWEQLYAPFIRDCIQNHDQLHPRIQSWYTCLAGHWHLATLLLADLLEIIDDSELGEEEARSRRASANFVSYFRESNCRVVSEMAKCACPRDDATFQNSHEFHFALNQGSLLTEPWTAVLIRAFAKAGVILLEADTMLPFHCLTDSEENFQRADDCVRALWYLGRKSDMARTTAKILGEALKERRKGVQEKVNDMSSFLETDLWHGFEDTAFGVDCEA